MKYEQAHVTIKILNFTRRYHKHEKGRNVNIDKYSRKYRIFSINRLTNYAEKAIINRAT